ncbi:hypothetical protein KJY73_04175 [Bowmanella sp. Y26]|uniref:hypothetical protein n=1 Tax=Bowmanella yangjiangensis TaxID=2811230 RepID=UPI001BDC9060|nr:hypothetical protein [Bowmanella yangjiangensis]MBT1062756.1 hypothetical protein [Bowmanella yangjiangensis]
MKKSSICLLLAGMFAASVQAASQLDELSKELEIMSSIMQTSYKQNRDKKGISVRSLQSTYLAGQGVVFRIQTSGGSNRFRFSFNGLDHVIPVPPIEPQIEVRGNAVVIENEGHVIEYESIGDELERVRELFIESNDKLSELRDKQRELNWEAREVERRNRDNEFEKRHAEGERRAELEKETQELQKELAKIKERQREVEKYAQQLEEEQREANNKRMAAAQEQSKKFLAEFEHNSADILCKYGSGLKSLPAGEHITLVLDSYADGKGRNKSQDRIYVFDYKDVQSCVSGKLDPQKLLGKANTYEF